jgi:hypothetical protein
MRWPPLLLNVALTIALWIAVLWLLRVRRVRMGDSPSPRAVRGHRLHTAAAITATVGVTWFAAWLLTDALGPHSLAGFGPAVRGGLTARRLHRPPRLRARAPRLRRAPRGRPADHPEGYEVWVSCSLRRAPRAVKSLAFEN